MKILITGGGGFIGSSLIKFLANDNEIISYGHGNNYDILKRTIPEGVDWITGDLTDGNLLEHVMQNVDAVIHLAGVAGERLCKEDPCHAVLSNIIGTDNLVHQARSSGVKHFIFSSSYWVYSFFENRRLPLKEDDQLRTDSFYGALKAASENQLLSESSSQMKITILRLATVYGYGAGVGAQWRGLIGKYIQAAYNRMPKIVFGDGNQKIDFIHINDIITVIRNLLHHPNSNSILNLGGGRPVSILEMAQLVSRLSDEELGSRGEILFQPAPPGKIWPDRWLSIERIQKLYPDYPMINLETGIREMMKKYKEKVK
jgi:UDP-glucose 4-epimerase